MAGAAIGLVVGLTLVGPVVRALGIVDVAAGAFVGAAITVGSVLFGALLGDAIGED